MVRKFATWILQLDDAGGAPVMHPGARRAALPLFAVSALLLLVTAQGCGSPASGGSADNLGQSEQDLGGTIMCGTYPGVDDDGHAAQLPEYYITYSMNRKLKYFPEFASAIGVRSVKTCDEARAFSVAYADYFNKHPYFDKDLPSSPGAHRFPGPTSEAVASNAVRKIFNGQAAGPSGIDPYPVVQIIHRYANNVTFADGSPLTVSSSKCSGTFIAKNFILTSAHCFATLAMTFPRFQPGVPPVVTAAGQQWITDSEWTIKWPDAGGGVSDDMTGAGGMMTITVKTARSIVHPSYDGALAPRVYRAGGADSNSAAYDIALLWISGADNDYQLPADAEKSTWDVQKADEGPLFGNWMLNVYGYGPTAEVSAVSALTAWIGGPPSGSSIEAGLIVTPENNSATDWGICSGDSGGPLVREVRVPPITGAVVATVVVGVNSRASDDGTNTRCPSGSPRFSKFARTDVAVPFLTDIIGSWQPGGTQNITENGVQNSYIKFHGKSCQTDCICASNETCFNPVNDANSPSSMKSGCFNNVCTNCSCVMGQCALSPGATAGAGTARQCP